MGKIDVRNEPPFAWVTIDRPEVRNAFDGETLTALAAAFRSFEPSGPVRVAFLQGAGGFFSAGADLNWMRGGRDDGEESFHDSSRVLADSLSALSSCAVPTVALVEKGALGGAVGLVAACDFALATEDT
ncbi:MAG: enoyl-CoA hydratase/isomerase family protein, partial [Planctomycetota bacterium]